MNDLAVELNKTLENTIVWDLLSDFGRRFYFPKGIVAQSTEAKQKAHRLNATIGIAKLDGEPFFLPTIMKSVDGLSPDEIFSYAPTPGVPELRRVWRDHMAAKNPDLTGKATSSPLVTCGLTHGISMVADLFAGSEDTLILPDMFWGNYRLIFEDRRQSAVKTFSLFNSQGGLNLEALQQAIAPLSKAILLLNFPNNPTGYSPSTSEAEALIDLLIGLAGQGKKLLVICDDAYFGLFYEADTYKQSLFARLADAHENILTVKVDGATKEDLVWGFRLGFITFAAKGLGEAHYDALVRKVMGAIRSSVSNSNHLGQSLLLKALNAASYAEEKKKAYSILEARYKKVKEILRTPHQPLEALPFNSGYFMTFRMLDGSAEALRLSLLDDLGIGTISIQDKYLRVAYSSVDLEDLEELYHTIIQAAKKMAS